MNPIPGVLVKLDELQRTHRAVAFGFAVNKKYGDDRGGYLAALITYYGFLSIFPLLLAFFTIVAYTLPPNGATIRSLNDHLGSYPIIGQSITELSKHSLHGSVLALVVGFLGLIWGGKGLAQTLQFSMNEVWSVPGKDRPGFAPRLLKGLEWYATFGIGFVASTFVSSLGSVLNWGPAGPFLASLPALVINVGLFVVSFRVLSPKDVTVRQLLPGAAFAGLIWTVLTTVGIGLLKQMSSSNALYGTFGVTLGLLGFLYLAARITLYAAEANVVAAKHLWPRSLRNPPLVEADKRQLEAMAQREERVEDQVVQVEFEAGSDAAKP
ncbi:MAG: YihY/virulence factor BrkB family protein [Actinomycetota bacterium]|nr:YihY/virulence factor BrkB family protein [Actinomycetota bacterium]